MGDIQILLVDDETHFRETVAKRLKKRGMTVMQASDGQECIKRIANDSVDVVLLDVKMPGMDGIETLHRIKEMHPDMEVIMLTGHACTQDGVDGIKSGAFDYLSKPIEMEHLVSKISQAFEKRNRKREKQKEQDFRAKMEQQMIATERLASLGTLAAGVAHEINNPLAIIREATGWMKSILEKEDSAHMPRKGDFEKALGKIENGVERVRRITHQLLGSVKQRDAVISEVNLKKMVSETLELILKEATDKNIQVLQETGSGDDIIWTDPYKLRQVLINIINNAVHATDNGGTITLTLEVFDNDVVLHIADTGQGIPSEHLEKIFEPFFSTKPPGEGTGLGLFVSRSIIEKLGGRIDVESRLGRGTRFSINLPKHPHVKGEMDHGQDTDKSSSGGR